MNAVDVLQYGHTFVLGALSGIPDAEWETPNVCGIWSVKQIIAHLASFEQLLVEVLAGFHSGEATPTLDALLALGGEGFNDAEVARRDGRHRREVMAEYESCHEQTLELIRQIPLETRRGTGSLPWYGAEYALDDLIVYMYYGHKREHGAQINIFKDQFKQP